MRSMGDAIRMGTYAGVQIIGTVHRDDESADRCLRARTWGEFRSYLVLLQGR
jgi:hypothetical protein